MVSELIFIEIINCPKDPLLSKITAVIFDTSRGNTIFSYWIMQVPFNFTVGSVANFFIYMVKYKIEVLPNNAVPMYLKFNISPLDNFVFVF